MSSLGYYVAIQLYTYGYNVVVYCRITQRQCYLNSPIITEQLILAHRDRMTSTEPSDTLINIVVEVSGQDQPVKMKCEGEYSQ